MNLKQAGYIRAIAREGGVTAAARKLYISQPALSQMLRQVEAELGVELFDRGSVPLRPTFAGEKYLEAADAMLAASRRLENQLREIREENSGRLRLGISVQRAGQVLPLALPWFVMQYPHVSLEITERGSADLEELVSRGEVDLALAAIASASPRLAYELIEKEVIGVLAGEGSLLAARYLPGTAVELKAAGEDVFVVLKEGHSVRVVQDMLFRKYGMEPWCSWRRIPWRWPSGWPWGPGAACCARTSMWTVWFAATEASIPWRTMKTTGISTPAIPESRPCPATPPDSYRLSSR